MEDYTRKRHKDFISRIIERFSKKSLLTRTDYEYIFNSLIELLELPFPPSELKPYFIHPNIIFELFLKAFNSNNLTRDDRQDMHKSFKNVNKLIRRTKSAFSINLRILAPGGSYPNIELERGYCKYTINNQYPVLITKNRNKKDFWADKSIINWLTRSELKIATSIMCSPEKGNPHFHFTSYNTLNIDYDCIRKVPQEIKVSFLKEVLDIERRFHRIGANSWNRKVLADVNEYEFFDFQTHTKAFKKLFDSFSIQDDLLLRTSNYFVKARMHWDNLISAEEAIANNLMCLEGCLHLIQKKHHDFSTQLNLNLLEKIFKNEIQYGAHMLDFIKEGYSTRISLIHAEPKWGANWDSNVTSEDFYEYFRVSKILLNYILIDRHLEY